MSNLFSRLSIRTRLVAGLGLLLLATAALGLFTMQRMSAMNDASKVVTTNYFPSLAVTAHMRNLALQFRISENHYLFPKNAEDTHATQKVMTALADQYAMERKGYEKLIDAGEETDLFKGIDAAWSRYLAMHDQLVAVFAKDGKDKASAFLTSDMDAPFN